jgi:hypothetical protein
MIYVKGLIILVLVLLVLSHLTFFVEAIKKENTASDNNFAVVRAGVIAILSMLLYIL